MKSTVWRDVVAEFEIQRQVVAGEQLSWRIQAKLRSSGYLDLEHAVPVRVEETIATAVPAWFAPSVRRDAPAAGRFRETGEHDIPDAVGVGPVGQQAIVRREFRFTLLQFRTENRVGFG